MIITAIISFIIPDFIYFTQKEVLTDRVIVLEKSPEKSSDYHYIWWGLKEGQLVLYTSLENIDKSLKVYGIKSDVTSDEIPLSTKNNSLPVEEIFTGGFNSSLKPFKADLDNDGKKETVYCFAKIDTIYVQGFVYVPTMFEKEKIALDVNIVDNHHLSVFFKGKALLNKEISITSKRGLNEKVKVSSDGTIKMKNINDIRSGLTIAYKENNNLYVANYIAEGHTMFSSNHYKAIFPLFFIIALSAEIILLIIIIKQSILKNRKILYEITPE